MADRSILIPVGSATAVAGVAWTVLRQDPKQEVKTACRNSGSKHGLIIETPSGRRLLGLVPVSSPSRAKSSYSAAAWLANATLVPVLFIKLLSTGDFWVLCVKPGEIDHRSDDIVQEDGAIQIIDLVLSDSQHDPENAKMRVVIDGDRSPNSRMLAADKKREHATFADLVRGYAPTSAERIKKIVGITAMQLVVVATLAAILAGGYFAYQMYEDGVRAAEIAAQQAELQRKKLTLQQIKTETDLRITKSIIAAVEEDTATPAPEAIIKACLATLRGVGDELAGWRLSQVQCSPLGTSVDLSYQMLVDTGAAGTNASLISQSRARFGIAPSILLGANRAELQLPLVAPPNRAALSPPQLPRYPTVVEVFGTRFQMLQQGLDAVHVTISSPARRSIQYLDPAKEGSQDPSRFVQVPDDRGYSKGTIQITGTNLWQLEQFSLAYPFLTIKKIEATPSGSDSDAYQWRVEGEYVSSRS
jgi:hypothetical protein